MNLTPRQVEIVNAIRAYRLEHGCAPTMQELAEELGVTKTTTFEHVGDMEKKHVLTRDKHKARSIQLIEDPHAAMCVAVRQIAKRVRAVSKALAAELEAAVR